MYNFFVDERARVGGSFSISGKDHNHICNVLRMQIGDTFLVSCAGTSSLCRLKFIGDDALEAEIVEEDYRNTELPVRFYLFQGLPKGDKLELIIQKTVELGVAGIIPVEMSRCVMKLDDKKKKARRERWQSIAESAAKQSKRNVIPEVSDVMTYKQAMEKAAEMDLFLVPYENERGMAETREALSRMKPGMSVGILVGPEGGFDEKEIELARQAGAAVISLGKRILRAETAAVTAVGLGMLHVEMNLDGGEQ
ncbi:MAG: 16S rRNA (uracil(1498)-N(3))-methyltransferase [Oscillospiraceae bacterium]|nr:16S rRNA (uracil(1498)-N(3))-methyltransferase [Oscillospiraceae bacterium]